MDNFGLVSVPSAEVTRPVELIGVLWEGWVLEFGGRILVLVPVGISARIIHPANVVGAQVTRVCSLRGLMHLDEGVFIIDDKLEGICT